MPEEFITGYVSSRRVFFGTKNNERILELEPDASQKIVNHSPDGFNWGYGGSGPSQLALAIMLYLTSEANALELYQDYKSEIIAPLSGDKDFQISKRSTLEWIDKKLDL